LFDGKATRPDGGSAATLIPNASGLAGFNLHTWTGGWGTVTYWKALVAALELHRVGTFFDEGLDDSNKFPIAATMRFGHTAIADPDDGGATTTRRANGCRRTLFGPQAPGIRCCWSFPACASSPCAMVSR
jgi:hypothetical protein